MCVGVVSVHVHTIMHAPVWMHTWKPEDNLNVFLDLSPPHLWDRICLWTFVSSVRLVRQWAPGSLPSLRALAIAIDACPCSQLQSGSRRPELKSTGLRNQHVTPESSPWPHISNLIYVWQKSDMFSQLLWHPGLVMEMKLILPNERNVKIWWRILSELCRPNYCDSALPLSFSCFESRYGGSLSFPLRRKVSEEEANIRTRIPVLTRNFLINIRGHLSLFSLSSSKANYA